MRIKQIVSVGCLTVALGCGSSQVKPAAPMPPVEHQKPAQILPPKEEKSKILESEIPKERLQNALYWLAVLSANLGVKLEKAMEICAVMELQMQHRNSEGGHNWFQCGGNEGYTIAVNDEGTTVYVADSNFPDFSLEVLTKLFGPAVRQHEENITMYVWHVSTKADSVGILVDFVVPDDLTVHPPFLALELPQEK
jgi:hypothetical protein